MLHNSLNTGKNRSLLDEYGALLGNAALRQRALWAEQASRGEAEQTDRLKTEFIANMSHELRTPLNSIMGFSKLLTEHEQRRLDNEKVTEYASIIHSAAEHLLAIINDILDISKLQSGKATFTPDQVNLAEIVKWSVKQFSVSAAEANVRLEYAGTGNALVLGEISKIRQIVTNLIGNAIKFTPEGGAVQAGAKVAPDGMIALTIRDNGVGLTKDELAIAMMPFGQIDGSRARSHDGTGLGLSITKALVELHGGELVITGIENVGTEVIVRFPALPQPQFDCDKSTQL